MLNKNLNMQNISDNYNLKDRDHIPVLLNEIKEKLNIKDGYTYIDGTYGSGGHTEMVLSSADCNVISIDRDPNVEKIAQKTKKKFPEKFEFIIGKIGNLSNLMKRKGIKNIDGGIIFDLGVSSMQLNDSSRGFSFRLDGPLDMRMGKNGETAADIIKNYDESTLAKIIHTFGDEHKARHIAKAIVKNRAIKNISSTHQLAEIVRSVVGYSRHRKIDPATKTFQALRIKVNNELYEINKALIAAENLLEPGARLLVISFHSLEDKIVKSFLKEKSGNHSNPYRHEILLKDNSSEISATFKIINKKVITASKEEIMINPRSRSARLRVAEKINYNLDHAA